MSEHVRDDQLEQLRRGGLRPGELLAVARHLASCADCATRSREQTGTARAARALRAEIAEEHPPVDDLFAYAEGTLPAERRAEVEEHVAQCPTCSEDVEDVRRVRRTMQRPPRRILWLAAAAVLVPVIAATLLLRRHEPPAPAPLPVRPITRTLAPPQGYGHADWDALVRDAMSSRRLPQPPFAAELHDHRDEPRGAEASAPARLRPTGVVVEADTPSFTWPHAGRAYVVEVFDGERRIARSDTLHETRWTPGDPLPRGRTLLWQVRVEGGQEPILPAPPDPPARFRIADAESLQQIEEARRRFPNDRLLIGLLEARAGLREAAARELAAYAKEHPTEAAAQELARSAGV